MMKLVKDHMININDESGLGCATKHKAGADQIACAMNDDEILKQ